MVSLSSSDKSGTHSKTDHACFHFVIMSHSLYLSVVSEFIVILSVIHVSVTVQDNSSNTESTFNSRKVQLNVFTSVFSI